MCLSLVSVSSSLVLGRLEVGNCTLLLVLTFSCPPPSQLATESHVPPVLAAHPGVQGIGLAPGFLQSEVSRVVERYVAVAQ